MGRSPCCEKAGLKKGRWTSEEDEALKNYIQANGEGSWRSLPKNAGLLRCGKSCRLRWMNYLRGDLKRGNITVQEEETIVNLHTALGNKWSLIAAQLPGRTDNEIKNYWNSHLRRKIYSFTYTKTKPSLHAAEAAEGQGKRKGGEGQSNGTATADGEVLGSSAAVQIQGVEASGSSVDGENGMVKQVIIKDRRHHDDDEKDVDGVQKDDHDDGERSSNAEMRMSSGTGEWQELDVDYWENYGGVFYDDQWRLSDDSDEVFCWLFDGNNADEAGSTPD